MDRKRAIEIPLQKVVHSFFSHPSNLGVNPSIEKRHWLGKHVTSIMSYIPLSENDLPFKPKIKSFDSYETYAIEITFPLKMRLITAHHLWSLSACMDSVFEISLMNFCRGRFYHSPNYHAAIDDFFERYNLYKTDVDKDYYRRFVSKKYGSVINAELKALDKMREEKTKEQLQSYMSN